MEQMGDDRPAADAPAVRDYPDDPTSWQVEDQFLFGAGHAGRPGLHRGARERRSGCRRRHLVNAWSGPNTRAAVGGSPAPLDTIPVYLRQGGAVAPFGPFADRVRRGVA